MSEGGPTLVQEVELAREAIEVWRQWRGGAEPSAAQRSAIARLDQEAAVGLRERDAVTCLKRGDLSNREHRTELIAVLKRTERRKVGVGLGYGHRDTRGHANLSDPDT